MGRAEGVLSVLSRPLQINIWTDGVLSFIPPEEREIEKEGEREKFYWLQFVNHISITLVRENSNDFHITYHV